MLALQKWSELLFSLARLIFHFKRGTLFRPALPAIILDVVCLGGPMTVATLALLVSVGTRGEERHHVPGRNRV